MRHIDEPNPYTHGEDMIDRYKAKILELRNCNYSLAEIESQLNVKIVGLPQNILLYEESLASGDYTIMPLEKVNRQCKFTAINSGTLEIGM